MAGSTNAPTSDRIRTIVLASLREHLDGTGNAVPQLGPDTPLLGRQGVVDSLGLVSVIVSVEQAIEDDLGCSVSLADERAFSQRTSPFRTVESLSAYAESLVASVA